MKTQPRQAPGFGRALDELLSDAVVDLHAWPGLRELAWNRRDRWIPVEEAVALYERNRRFLDVEGLGPDEQRLIDRLRDLAAGPGA